MTYRKRYVRDSSPAYSGLVNSYVKDLLRKKDNFVDEDGEIDTNELDAEIDEYLDDIYNDIGNITENSILMELFKEYYEIDKYSIQDIPTLFYQDIRDGVLRKLGK